MTQIYTKGKLNMNNLIIRAVKLTGISSNPKQKPDVRSIPIVSLSQLSDDRWNELARLNRKAREIYG